MEIYHLRRVNRSQGKRKVLAIKDGALLHSVISTEDLEVFSSRDIVSCS